MADKVFKGWSSIRESCIRIALFLLMVNAFLWQPGEWTVDAEIVKKGNASFSLKDIKLCL